MKTELKERDVVLFEYRNSIYMGVVYSIDFDSIDIQYDWYYGFIIKDLSKVYKVGEL